MRSMAALSIVLVQTLLTAFASPIFDVARWQEPGLIRELKSEEELLATEERRELVLEITNIVINCPVTRSASGQAIRGVR